MARNRDLRRCARHRYGDLPRAGALLQRLRSAARLEPLTHSVPRCWQRTERRGAAATPLRGPLRGIALEDYCPTAEHPTTCAPPMMLSHGKCARRLHREAYTERAMLLRGETRAQLATGCHENLAVDLFDARGRGCAVRMCGRCAVRPHRGRTDREAVPVRLPHAAAARELKRARRGRTCPLS